MVFKPALTVKKEYAEKPFDLWGFRGTNRQFTVIEDLKVVAQPRMSKKTGTSKAGKPYSIEVMLIKVSDGIFEKDMELSEKDWQAFNYVRPDNLISLKGVTMAYQGNELTFIGVATPDMNENFPQQPTRAPEHEQSTLDLRIRALKEAMSLTASLGTKIDSKIMIVLAERFEPGNALGLIGSAKNSGQIMEKEGIFYTV